MANRLSLEQRRVVVSLMEIFCSQTKVRRDFVKQFPDRNPPSRLSIYRIYAKFVPTEYVADNYRGNTAQNS